MSFASETKNELARIIPEKKCCMLAQIMGFIRVNGSIILVGFGKFNIVVKTENPAVARNFKTLIKEYFDVDTKLIVEENAGIRKTNLYSITIDENKSKQILREIGVLMVKEGNDYITDGLYFDVMKKKCCKKSCVRGLLMGSGTVIDPAKQYRFEIISKTEQKANDIKRLLNTFYDIDAKVSYRNDSYVVYVTGAQSVSDLLALTGANNAMFELENVRITKDLHNKVNRINNCDQANINKSLDASARYIDAIKKIDSIIGIHLLPEKLREVAELRINNPDVSLTELGKLLKAPIQKAGVAKRLKKIVDIADNL
ncbi:MAG: DNA-binding protein WhiA [Eubacteriales bacterium]|nr:DNA-binding protein WhiA [Eubacteriales bacterium]MDY3333068.1 DNA-binding protein WhiA [Gallibacter sp.]